MTMNETWTSHIHGNLIMVVTYLFISLAIGLTLVGCGANGDGGPTVSSLSASTDTTSDPTSDSPASDSIEAQQAGQEDSAASPSPDATAGLTSDPGPDSSEEDSQPFPSDDDAMITMTPTETGVTALLTWDPSSDTDTTGYYIYYGKQPSGELGSCSYEQSQAIEAPPATITGLEPNTPYYFAISAFNEAESPCSIEVMMVTPPAKS